MHEGGDVATRTLLRGGIVLPMTGRHDALDPGSVLVDGRVIVAVGPVETLDADPRAAGALVVDCADHAVLPGLHNCHLHSGLLRGTAESLSLWDWLETYVDPAHRALTPGIAEAASLLCYAEAVLTGTTSVMGMWRHMEGSAAVAERIGLRATLVPYVADAPGYDYFESIATNRALLESHRSAADGRVRTWVGLEHLFYCTDECFAAAVDLAAEFDTGLHTHSSESIWEVQESLRRFGRRPIEVFFQRRILSERTVVAHCVWLDDREIELLAQTGTSVAHCPCSNMKLSSGPARIGALRDAGVVVGLGSDGEKENNNLDLLEEMKFASLLQKVSTLDPTTGDPWDVLAMATVDGARALHSTASPARWNPASAPTSSRSRSTGCTPRRCCTAASSTLPPISCSPRPVATCGSTAGDSWTRGRRRPSTSRPCARPRRRRPKSCSNAASETATRRMSQLAVERRRVR
jgi:5-methylthioadenosine/S-adenosylhomocysteine deaminase